MRESEGVKRDREGERVRESEGERKREVEGVGGGRYIVGLIEG